MKIDRLFVFDNNVLVSAFFFKNSNPRRALDLALSLGRILRSEETLEELWEVLVRPKFDRYLPLSERIYLLRYFEQLTQHYSVTVSLDLCRDKKDDKFLNLAFLAKAECIISGDYDLLSLGEEFQIPILTPVQFIDLNS